MIRITTFVAALALPTLAFAQSVSFTPPKAMAVGDVMNEVETQDMSMEMVVKTPDGQTINMPTAEKGTTDVRYEVMAIADGKVTSMKVTVNADSKTGSQGPRERTMESPLKGKTFVLTQTEGGVKVTDDAGNELEPTEAEAAKQGYAKKLGETVEKANKFAKVFDKESYKIGDTITIDGDKAKELFSDDPKEDAAMQDVSLVMTLQSVKTVDGQEVAVFDSVMKMSGGEPADGMKMGAELKGPVEILTSNSNLHRMAMTGPMSLTADKDGMSMEGKGTMAMETSRTYK